MQIKRFVIHFCIETESLEQVQALLNFLEANEIAFRASEAIEVPNPEASGAACLLTPAEQALLCALLEKDTITDAATAVFISRSTARTHLERIYTKLGVHSLHRAIVEALRRGLISLSKGEAVCYPVAIPRLRLGRTVPACHPERSEEPHPLRNGRVQPDNNPD